MTNRSVADRLAELEFQFTHLQRAFDDLNDVVTQETTRSDKLAAQVRTLNDELRRVKAKADPPEQSVDPEDERPPHY